jgi:hypothetical protein
VDGVAARVAGLDDAAGRYSGRRGRPESLSLAAGCPRLPRLFLSLTIRVGAPLFATQARDVLSASFCLVAKGGI